MQLETFLIHVSVSSMLSMVIHRWTLPCSLCRSVAVYLFRDVMPFQTDGCLPHQTFAKKRRSRRKEEVEEQQEQEWKKRERKKKKKKEQ